MNNVRPSQASLKKRKMLLLIPLLVVPFITLLFWSLGGGQGQGEERMQPVEGINFNLPGAALKEEKGLNKLSFYELAQKDSLALEERLKSDVYWKGADSEKVQLPAVLPSDEMNLDRYGNTSSAGLKTSPYQASNKKPEDQLLDKLAQLQKSLEGGEVVEGAPPTKKQEIENTEGFTDQVDRLAEMMEAMNSGSGEDPEMAQLQSTLEKLLDVQHPQRVRERLKAASRQHPQKVYAVSRASQAARVSLMDTTPSSNQVALKFYTYSQQMNESQKSSVEAVVHQTQVLVTGSVVRLRLLGDLLIGGNLLSKGSFVFALATLNGERLELAVPSVRIGSALYPVKMQGYDLDGLPGIWVPGAIPREVAKQSVDDWVNQLEIGSLDPTLKAQAASAGIGAVKSLLSRKVKQVKVTVKAGYQLLLKSEESSL